MYAWTFYQGWVLNKFSFPYLWRFLMSWLMTWRKDQEYKRSEGKPPPLFLPNGERCTIWIGRLRCHKPGAFDRGGLLSSTRIAIVCSWANTGALMYQKMPSRRHLHPSPPLWGDTAWFLVSMLTWQRSWIFMWMSTVMKLHFLCVT